MEELSKFHKQFVVKLFQSIKIAYYYITVILPHSKILTSNFSKKFANPWKTVSKLFRCFVYPYYCSKVLSIL